MLLIGRVAGVMVSIAAFQAVDPGSIPGSRTVLMIPVVITLSFFFYLSCSPSPSPFLLFSLEREGKEILYEKKERKEKSIQK